MKISDKISSISKEIDYKLPEQYNFLSSLFYTRKSINFLWKNALSNLDTKETSSLNSILDDYSKLDRRLDKQEGSSSELNAYKIAIDVLVRVHGIKQEEATIATLHYFLSTEDASVLKQLRKDGVHPENFKSLFGE
jgi:hypothetical protein